VKTFYFSTDGKVQNSIIHLKGKLYLC